jgi:hypothetical protein
MTPFSVTMSTAESRKVRTLTTDCLEHGIQASNASTSRQTWASQPAIHGFDKLFKTVAVARTSSQADLFQVRKNGRKFGHLIGKGANTNCAFVVRGCKFNQLQQRARLADVGKDLSRDCSARIGKAKALEGCNLRTLDNLKKATHASESLLGLLEIIRKVNSLSTWTGHSTKLRPVRSSARDPSWARSPERGM